MKRYVVCWFLFFISHVRIYCILNIFQSQLRQLNVHEIFTVCLMFDLFKLHRMKFGCKQYQEIRLQRAIPVKKAVPPSTIKIFPRRLWYHCLPDHSQAHDFYQKGDCMYELLGRKEEGACVKNFLSAKNSYAHVPMSSLSENRSVAPQNHQNISEAKY